MNAGLSRGWRKGVRTLAQIIAGGALTALVTEIVGGLPPSSQGLLMGAWVAVVAFVQNWAEGSGRVREFLPVPSLVAGPASDAVATVEAQADETGDITGTVTDTEGATVGEVVGQLGYVDKPKGDDEHGGAGLVTLAIIGFAILLLIGGFAFCDLLIDDQSEPGDNHLFGRVELVSR